MLLFSDGALDKSPAVFFGRKSRGGRRNKSERLYWNEVLITRREKGTDFGGVANAVTEGEAYEHRRSEQGVKIRCERGPRVAWAWALASSLPAPCAAHMCALALHENLRPALFVALSRAAAFPSRLICLCASFAALWQLRNETTRERERVFPIFAVDDLVEFAAAIMRPAPSASLCRRPRSTISVDLSGNSINCIA